MALKLPKNSLVLVGLVVLLLAAAGATAYMMWRCSKPEPALDGFAAEKADKTVEYFAMEGCPYCKAFDPIWSAVAAEIKASEAASSLSLHRWDVKEPDGKRKAEDAGVTAFPHVQKTNPDGTVEVFSGKRTEGELKDFCLS